MSEQGEISQALKRRDHEEKVTGRCLFADDFPMDNILFGKILRSEKAHARILKVEVPPLPNGYFYIDAGDIPGTNGVFIISNDMPVYARETAAFIGEAIGMIAGPCRKTVQRLLQECNVLYEELEPVTDVRKSEVVFNEYRYSHGNPDQAFEEADRIMEEEFETGYQEQAYLEPQSITAEFEENGRMLVHGSMQNAKYVEQALREVLACGKEEIHVRQDVTGGGFGGKEEYPSILACQTAVAARKCGKAVRCVFDRREDMMVTSKRHPSICRYRAAIKDGRITAFDIDVILNAGAYPTLSILILQRALFMAPGIYNVSNLRVRGRTVKTNTVPCGAFRGFGGPQVFFASEMFMSHIAASLGWDPLSFKLSQLVRQGDRTPTGGRYHGPVPIAEMVDVIDESAQYRKKREEYAKPQSGRYRYGIGLSLIAHGAGLNGSSERDLGSAVKLHKDKTGRVEILAGNGEIGQGLRTTFPKIVAEALRRPVETVFYEHPDTARVPDSGLTAGSRSIVIVGELLRRAAEKLREEWIDGMEQETEEHYHDPEFLISFDLEKFEGDAYQDYSWAVSVIEVKIDTLTGKTEIPGAWAIYDIGTPIDRNIAIGQMEGGFLQGYGFAAMEKMNYDGRGFIRNNSFSDYLIPCSKDLPNLKVFLYEGKRYFGPFGAKAAGELPVVGVPAAYLEAVEQALGGVSLHHVPFNLEDIADVLSKKEEF